MPAVVAAAAVGAVGKLEPDELELELVPLLVVVLVLLEELGLLLLLVVDEVVVLLLPQPAATRASALTVQAAMPLHRKEPFTLSLLF